MCFSQDGSLLKLLQESMREGEKKMEAIVEKFVVRQEQECSGQQSQDGESSSATEEEEEEEEEEDKEREGQFLTLQLCGAILW